MTPQPDEPLPVEASIPDVNQSDGADERPSSDENPNIAPPQDSATDDSDQSSHQGQKGNRSASSEVDDPDKQHRRGIESKKLSFGIWLIGGCLVAVVLLAILERYVPAAPKATGFSTIIDLLKLMATTVLGYVFGRGVASSNDDQ